MLLIFHQRRLGFWWSVARRLAVVVALWLPVFHVSTQIHLASEPHAGFVPLVSGADEHGGKDAGHDGHWHHGDGGQHHHHHDHHHHHHGGGGHGHFHGHGGEGAGSDSDGGSDHHHSHAASDHLASFYYIASPYVVAPVPRVDGESAVLCLPESACCSFVDSALRPRAPPGCLGLLA